MNLKYSLSRKNSLIWHRFSRAISLDRHLFFSLFMRFSPIFSSSWAAVCEKPYVKVKEIIHVVWKPAAQRSVQANQRSLQSYSTWPTNPEGPSSRALQLADKPCWASCTNNEPMAPIFLLNILKHRLLPGSTAIPLSKTTVFSETTKSFETMDFCKFSDTVRKKSFFQPFSFLSHVELISRAKLKLFGGVNLSSTGSCSESTATFQNETLDALCQCFFCGKTLLHLFILCSSVAKEGARSNEKLWTECFVWYQNKPQLMVRYYFCITCNDADTTLSTQR